MDLAEEVPSLERLEVDGADPHALQVPPQIGGNKVEFVVDVVLGVRIERRQPLTHCEPWSDREELRVVATRPTATRTLAAIHCVPRDHHAHRGGLARSGRHLEGLPEQAVVVADAGLAHFGKQCASLTALRNLGQPDRVLIASTCVKNSRRRMFGSVQ